MRRWVCKEFNEPACVIVKHANPCGVAVSNSILDAYDRAYKTDPTSAFGGIIAFNRELDAETAQAIISPVRRSDHRAVRQRRSAENHRREAERPRTDLRPVGYSRCRPRFQTR